MALSHTVYDIQQDQSGREDYELNGIAGGRSHGRSRHQEADEQVGLFIESIAQGRQNLESQGHLVDEIHDEHRQADGDRHKQQLGQQQLGPLERPDQPVLVHSGNGVLMNDSHRQRNDADEPGWGQQPHDFPGDG